MNLLSIDGGGIKGLYSAAFLAGLEHIYKKKTVECFDLVAGTSTGGIIALAIAAKISVKTIVSFFKDWGPKIFKSRLKGPKTLILSKYSNQCLTEALQDVFGNIKISDIYSKDDDLAVCIASIDAILGTPIVFKTPHDPGFSRDNDLFLWEVALATSASPTFFPIAKLDSRQSSSWKLYVDGGLWANNPGFIALTEALTYKKQVIKNIFMLSLGNITSTTTLKSNTFLQKGIAQWSVDFIKMTMNTQSIAIHNQVKLLFEKQGLRDHYTRIEHTASNNSSLQQLDCANRSNLNDLENLGNNRAYTESNNPSIRHFYAKGELDGKL